MQPRSLTLEEVARHDGRDGSYWVAIDGEVYDVSEFVPKHPGGSTLIELAAGRHGTVLFESYHPGPSLERARKVLTKRGQHVGSLRPEDREPYGDPSFFQAIQTRVGALLQERGFDYHTGARIAAIEGAIVALLAAVCWYFRAFHASYIAAVIGGLLMARMGFLMHSGNHASMGKRTRVNAWMGGLMEYIGGSSIIWRYAHQVAHHGRPNVYGIDHDCEIGTPLLRFHPEIERRPWHRIQWLLLGIGMSFGMVKWLISDVFNLRKRRVVNTTFHLSDAGLRRSMVYKIIWATFHVVIPVILIGPVHGILTTLVLLGVSSYYMEGIFIVNHIQKDLVPPPNLHWAEQQILGTTNWCAGKRWANFLSGGLNHQIEHHLFPSMAVHLYPIIAPTVQRTCEEYGLSYRNFSSFRAALWGTVGFLHHMGRPDAVADDEDEDEDEGASAGDYPKPVAHST